MKKTTSKKAGQMTAGTSRNQLVIKKVPTSRSINPTFLFGDPRRHGESKVPTSKREIV